MERKLTGLFDYQRFAGNERLAAVISDVESRYGKALSDDDLLMVSAAGDAHVPPEDPKEIKLCMPLIQPEGEES